MKKDLRLILLPNMEVHFGAPMGRDDVGSAAAADLKLRDCLVPINAGGYDAGGAYWGVGAPLRCQFQLNSAGTLVYRRFYRGKKVSP